MKNFRHQFRVN